MATCISPYQVEATQGLSVREIAEVYAALKAKTGSAIRGVGSLEKQVAEPDILSPAQATLLDNLLATALDLIFQYRVTMDCRDELPAFAEVIPADTIKYTMVTKRDKLVLYPNSRLTDAHAEPGELAVHPAVSPRRVLGRQTQH